MGPLKLPTIPTQSPVKALLFGRFFHNASSGLAGVLTEMYVLKMGIERALQGFLVFLASRARVGWLNLESHG